MAAEIMTRSTRWPRARSEDARRREIQRALIAHGLPALNEWTPPPSPVAVAFVNHGRWIAVCPRADVGCRGAELVDPDWPVYVCSSGCGAGPFGVVFPTDRDGIEAALLKRPLAENRNWVPYETAADLEAENAREMTG